MSRDQKQSQLWAHDTCFGDASHDYQTLFEHVVTAVENGGKKQPVVTQLGYTKEQVDAIQRLKTAGDNYERLGLQPGASK